MHSTIRSLKREMSRALLFPIDMNTTLQLSELLVSIKPCYHWHQNPVDLQGTIFFEILFFQAKQNITS